VPLFLKGTTRSGVFPLTIRASCLFPPSLVPLSPVRSVPDFPSHSFLSSLSLQSIYPPKRDSFFPLPSPSIIPIKFAPKSFHPPKFINLIEEDLREIPLTHSLRLQPSTASSAMDSDKHLPLLGKSTLFP